MSGSAPLFPDLDLWPLLDSALADALEQPESERMAFLEARLAAHPALLSKARRLLSGSAGAEAFFERQSAIFPFQGAELGAWRLERELGRGGMGVVWLASRADGNADMRAAIKLLNVPFASPDLIHRFQREKQILATLQHPHIAYLLDAGLGPREVTNFAMEFIDGLPLPEHCASLNLSLTARVRLARQLLDALQHAHSKLVIHRDLKPSNILCTAAGIPKLLDFGIARLLEDNPAAQTETLCRAFSADYASPEQLRGEAVSTATDIFSIGIVFYETFTGVRARQWSRRPIAEILRDADNFKLPAHPSLPPDLYAILLKATDPQAEARYPTASEFSADLGRFLDRLPVTARKAGVAYVVMRYARRHLLAVSAAALALSAILGVSAAAFYQARQAEAQRQLAVRRQKESERAAAQAIEAREFAQQSLARVEQLRQLSEQRREDILRLSYSLLEDAYLDIASLPGATPVRARLLERTIAHLNRLESSAPDDESLLLLLIEALGKLADTYAGQNSNLGDRDRGRSLLVRREALVERLGKLRPASFDVERLRLDNQVRTIRLSHSAPSWRAAVRLNALEPRVQRLLKAAPASRPLYRFATAYYFQRALSVDNRSSRIPLFRRVLQFASEDERLFGGEEVCWRSIALAHKYIAGNLADGGAECDSHARLAVAYDEKRVARNPGSATARIDLSFSQSTLATSLQAAGRQAEAAALFRDALNLRLNLLEIDPANAWYRESLWFPLLSLIRIHFSAGDGPALQASVEELARLAARFPPPPYAQATLLFMQAELLEQQSGRENACAAWNEARLSFETIPPASRNWFLYSAPLEMRLASCRATPPGSRKGFVDGLKHEPGSDFNAPRR